MAQGSHEGIPSLVGLLRALQPVVRLAEERKQLPVCFSTARLPFMLMFARRIARLRVVLTALANLSKTYLTNRYQRVT